MDVAKSRLSPSIRVTVFTVSPITAYFFFRGEPTLPAKAEWHRQERGFGSFERTFRLPVGVDANKVEARLENGVLTIQMAKRPEAKPRKIPVKAE